MSIRPEAAIVRRAGKVPRRDWIKNQMHIWQGRYVIGQLLEPARPCSFGGGSAYTRRQSSPFENISPGVSIGENLKMCKKKKEKRKGIPRKEGNHGFFGIYEDFSLYA